MNMTATAQDIRKSNRVRELGRLSKAELARRLREKGVITASTKCSKDELVSDLLQKEGYAL